MRFSIPLASNEISGGRGVDVVLPRAGHPSAYLHERRQPDTAGMRLYVRVRNAPYTTGVVSIGVNYISGCTQLPDSDTLFTPLQFDRTRDETTMTTGRDYKTPSHFLINATPDGTNRELR